MLGVIVTYLGLITTFVGTLSVLKPFGLLAIHSRGQALAVIAAGLVVVFIGGSLPAKQIRVTKACTQLDQFVAAWQFAEFHSIRIDASRIATSRIAASRIAASRIATSKEKVYTAIQQVTAEEILFFRTLIWIRRFGRPGPESVLNPPPNTPLLEVAIKTTFIVLAEEANHEIVLGALVATPRGWRSGGTRSPESFKALAASSQPGFAVAAMNFRLEDCSAASAGACVLLTTETRVYATDAPSRRRFARYWRVIYPGSSLIRIMWLRAIEKRAARA